MTRYTILLFADSGNWANPQPDDVRHATSKVAAAGWLSNWADTVGRYSDRRCARALVWRGDYDDVTDLYPDWQLTIGPRDGIRWEPA